MLSCGEARQAGSVQAVYGRYDAERDLVGVVWTGRAMNTTANKKNKSAGVSVGVWIIGGRAK